MNNPQPTPQEEYQLALNAYQNGDYPHAVFHLAFALMTNPNQAEWRGLLDKVIEQTGDKADQLIQPDENQGMHFSHAAIQAYIHATRSQYDPALQLISQIHSAIQNNIYLPWSTEWILASNTSGGLFKKPNPIHVDTLVTYIMRDMQAYTTGRPIPPESQTYYNQMLPIFEQVRQQNTQHAFYHSVLSSLLRRLDQMDKALEYAQLGYKLQPHHLTALMLALVYREQRDFQTSMQWYKKTLEFSPTDVSLHLDIGDLYIQMQQRANGIDYYRRAMRYEPDQPWATPHYYYYSYFEENDNQHLADLKAYCDKFPDNELASHLYQRIQDHLHRKPYVNYLPMPAEASISALQQVSQQYTDKKLKSADFKLSVSMLEAPSATLAIRCYFIENGEPNPTCIINVADIQQPDPRNPISNVPYKLWRYEGTNPIVNLPAPNPKLGEAISRIAVKPFHVDEWRSLARQLASKLGDANIPQLLAVMVHPAANTSPYPIWDWIYRCQMACALVIAYIGTEWETSERRKALLSLALGPMDWTTDAGLFALAQLAEADPKIATEVIKVYKRVYDNIPTQGHVPYIYALTALGLNLPELPQSFRQQLEQLKRDWFDS